MKFFGKFSIVFTAFIIISLATTDADAARSRKDYFLNPQAGVWFGPITPIGSTHQLVDTELGGGGFLRYNLPFKAWKIGIDSSYQHFKSRGVNEVYAVPVYGNFLYLLPFNLPVKMQLKAGFGETWVKIKPDNLEQWDPTFMTGFELSFPAGRIVNIGLRLDYLYIFEGYADDFKQSGHVFNAGITLFFNINMN